MIDGEDIDLDYFVRHNTHVQLSGHFLQRWLIRASDSTRKFPIRGFFLLLPKLAQLAFEHEPIKCVSHIGGNFYVAYRYDRRAKCLVIITVLPKGCAATDDPMTKLIPLVPIAKP